MRLRASLPRPTLGGTPYQREPMAKKNVIEVTCDRCARVEYIDPETTKLAGGLDLTFAGEKIAFPELCSRCGKAIANYIKQIKRAGKEEIEESPTSP